MLPIYFCCKSTGWRQITNFSLTKFSLIIYVLATLLWLIPFPLVFVGGHLAELLLFFKKSLMPYATTIASNDRYVIIKVADWILVNIYLPCVGTNDRWTISFNTLTLWTPEVGIPTLRKLPYAARKRYTVGTVCYRTCQTVGTVCYRTHQKSVYLRHDVYTPTARRRYTDFVF